MNSDKTKIQDLIEIMDKLLAPVTGCPWDLKQTPQTLAPYAIEEAHELAEAIESGDLAHIKEELGDLLLQVVFHAALAKRDGQFELNDVIEGICQKLVTRHPHVFGETKVRDSDEVLKNWEIIKNQEKNRGKSKLAGEFSIPVNLPALQRAQKIGDKTKTLKFDWLNPAEVFEKVEEEFSELKEAFNSGELNHTSEELGDLFFVLAQFARHLKLEAETVARSANRKFEGRFSRMIELAKQRAMDFSQISLEEKENLWSEIKRLEHK